MDDLIVDFDQPREKANFRRMVDCLSGKKRVTIKRHQKRRSNPQNAYLWGCVYPCFTEFRQSQGEEFTDEMAHEFFKLKFLRQTVVNKDTGEVLGTTVPSTTGLSVEEFSIYMEKVICWMNDFGIQVPQARAA